MAKILVIEDEAQSRDLLLEGLAAEGFEVLAASNSLIGIERIKQSWPDLVICDIIMPELDGYGVLSVLRQDRATATIPFIFLSAKGTMTELRQAMASGADDYLAKPLRLEELLGAIAARLKKQAALRQWYAVESQHTPALPLTEMVAKPKESQSILPCCPWLSEVFNYIEANYHQSISLCDVAKAVGYAPAYLTDLMRRQTGQPVNRWIVERRMAAAKTLLLETNQSVEQIAEAVGYQSVGCFFRQFRLFYGMTPKAWQKAQLAPRTSQQ